MTLYLIDAKGILFNFHREHIDVRGSDFGARRAGLQSGVAVYQT